MQDDVPTAESQLKLIDSLAALPTDRNGKSVLDGPSIQSTLATIGTGSDAARAKIRAAHIAVRNLDDEITAVKADLAKIATRSQGDHRSARDDRGERRGHRAG